MDYKVILAIGIPSLITIIGFIVNYKILNKSLKNEIKKHKESRIYDRKVDVIMESLYLIDSYFSWLDYPNNKCLPVREKKTAMDITVSFRKCYNELSVTCENKDILTTLISIFFPENDTNIFEKYNLFRNLARIELGLKEEIVFIRDKIFFSDISTDAIRANKD